MMDQSTMDAILFGVWVVSGMVASFWVGRVVGVCESRLWRDLRPRTALSVTPRRDLTAKDTEERIAAAKREFEFLEEYRDASDFGKMEAEFLGYILEHEQRKHRADGLFEEGYSDEYRRDAAASRMIEDVFRGKGEGGS